MARLARLSAAGQVHLVIQRGNNAQPIAGDDADRSRFLTSLGEAARSNRLEIHAYALTDNEFLMLATPADAIGLGRTMQGLGRLYVAYFNQRHGRSGTLWDGRFRSTVIEAALHLRDCMCFVESAPVRAGLVRMASDHRWSSAGHHLGLAVDPLVSDPPMYWASGNTPFEREDAHRALLERGLASEEALAIEASARKGWALGSAAFAAELERATARRTRPARSGRPVAQAKGSGS
jgi:putative transposase